MTVQAETHAACQALIGHLRAVLTTIAELTAQHQGQSPAQDVYERAQEALQVESGRDVQAELTLLREIMYHADELFRPFVRMTQGQMQEQHDLLMDALVAYEAFAWPRMWWEGRHV